MISVRQIIQVVLAAAVGIVYLGIGYYSTIAPHPPLLTIFLGIIPLCAILLVSAWHSRARIILLLVYAACALIVVMNIDYLRNHVAWLYFIQHAGAMSLLCIMFGTTLVGDHAGALCSRIADFVHRGSMDADYVHYTWNVTLAWTIFFALSAVVSVALFFFGSIEAWSVFANLLTPILLGVMFVGEYLIRLKVLPNRAHFSIAETIVAYREYSRRQNPN